MRISRMTSWAMVSLEGLIFTHHGPNQHGKYAGWVFTGGAGPKPLLNTGARFDTAKEAEDFMKQIRIDLIQQKITPEEICKNLKRLLAG